MQKECHCHKLVLKNELFKDIPGYEGRYQVSNLGRIKVHREKQKYKPMLCSIRATNSLSNGYKNITLGFKSRKKTFLIHRIVMLAFYGPPGGGMVVNHKDGIKYNNNLKNLEYITQKENIAHARENGKIPRGEQHYFSKFSEKDIIKVKKLIADGLTQKEVAHLFNVRQPTIHKIITGKTWSHLFKEP
jgi:hypothetical protein